MNYVDLTPTWEETIPLLITLIREAKTAEGLQHAEHELLKMARLADARLRAARRACPNLQKCHVMVIAFQHPHVKPVQS